MPLIPLRPLLDHAAASGYGVCALNVNNMEQIQAIMEAARATKSPTIIQASRGARKYSNDLFLRNLMRAAVEAVCEERMRQFGQAGQAPHVPRVGLRHAQHGLALGDARPFCANIFAVCGSRSALAKEMASMATSTTFLQLPANNRNRITRARSETSVVGGPTKRQGKAYKPACFIGPSRSRSRAGQSTHAT